jgi:hypothetical protein
MKAALKVVVVVWALVSLFSLAGLVYLFPSYATDCAFAEAFKTPENPDLLRWFHGSLILGILMTLCLWRTHRKHYGKLWRSN